MRQGLEALDSDGRTAYRDGNAAVIANLDVARILVVAGPGAGKSYLFMERILHWMKDLGAATPSHQDAAVTGTLSSIGLRSSGLASALLL